VCAPVAYVNVALQSAVSNPKGRAHNRPSRCIPPAPANPSPPPRARAPAAPVHRGRDAARGVCRPGPLRQSAAVGAQPVAGVRPATPAAIPPTAALRGPTAWDAAGVSSAAVRGTARRLPAGSWLPASHCLPTGRCLSAGQCLPAGHRLPPSAAWIWRVSVLTLTLPGLALGASPRTSLGGRICTCAVVGLLLAAGGFA